MLCTLFSVFDQRFLDLKNADDMVLNQVYIPFLVSVMCIVYTQAMFFTDSKDNDYPRIGKRLSASVLNKWLQRGEPDHSKPYTNTLREIILSQLTKESIYGKS